MGFFENLDISGLIKNVSAGLTQLAKDTSASEADIYKKATGKNKPTGKAGQPKASQQTAKRTGLMNTGTRRK